MTDRRAGPISSGGIIGAGRGSRLHADGLRVSKPMTRVAGRPLIEHAIERFRAVGISRPSIILNEESLDCREWLEARNAVSAVDLIVRTTPSSFASFQAVTGRLAGQRAVITTVDCIMTVAEFCGFVSADADFPDDALVLGLSHQVNDDNPLWVSLDPTDARVRKIGGDHGSHVTAGLYVVPACGVEKPETEFPRLRDYLAWLVDRRCPVYGVVLANVFDIDRIGDIHAAEHALFGRASRGAKT